MNVGYAVSEVESSLGVIGKGLLDFGGKGFDILNKCIHKSWPSLSYGWNFE